MFTEDTEWMLDFLVKSKIFNKYVELYEKQDSCRAYLQQKEYIPCMVEKVNYCYEKVLEEYNG